MPPANFPLRGFGHARIKSGAPPKRQEKQSLQAFFPVLARATSPLGVLGVSNPQAVPRASEVAARFFGFFACGAMPRNRAH